VVARRRFDDIPCSIARALDVIGEWWTPLVLRDIVYGLNRFDQIATDLPIARNVLAARLRALVEAEVLDRVRYADAPPRYEYHLTPRGRDAFGVLMALMAWGDRWAVGEDGPPVSLRCRSCDADTTPVVGCAACGAELRPDTVGVRPNVGQEVPRPMRVLQPADADADAR
jgi:DNA-binding HxlR family transcriptional regulator